jgi:glycosyltransferase involved in cell wall biosynthesis
MKKLSVIVACYNEEDKIGTCLDGLLKQTVKPYEIIVVDGRSTDKTVEIIKEYQKRSRLIKLFFEGNNRSPANARNIGWRKAKGDYLLFLDADSNIGEDFIGVLESHITGKKTDKHLVIYPSIINSWRELLNKYLWYGRTMPKYLMKNVWDFKTMGGLILSIFLLLSPFFLWIDLIKYVFFATVIAIFLYGLKTVIAIYKISKMKIFLILGFVYVFFIFIATGLGFLSAPILILLKKYKTGR